MKAALIAAACLLILLVLTLVGLWTLPTVAPSTLTMALAGDGIACRVTESSMVRSGEGEFAVRCRERVHLMFLELDCSESGLCSMGLEPSCWTVQEDVPVKALSDGNRVALGL